MISQELARKIKGEFKLNWTGIHGVPHWARVRVNGLRLAESTGAKPEIVELFAFLHDSCRRNEWIDPDHGARSAEFAGKVRGRYFDLSDGDFELLYLALSCHSDGLTRGDITVMTCWDADRLDLGRIGAHPDPERLCTDPAREPGVIEWAYKRSITGPGA